MENIFKNAKFGDKFRTRDGRMAIYSTDDVTGVYVYIDGYRLPIPYHYDGTQKVIGTPSPKIDIIGKWEETINEKHLNKLAGEYAENDNILNPECAAFCAFKAGYRKAKEE